MAAEVKGQFTRSQPCLPLVARPAAVLGRGLCRGLSPCEARVVLFAVGSLGVLAPRRRAFAGLRFRVVSSTFNEVEAKTRTSPKQVLNLQQNSVMLSRLGVTGGSNAGLPAGRSSEDPVLSPLYASHAASPVSQTSRLRGEEPNLRFGSDFCISQFFAKDVLPLLCMFVCLFLFVVF